jgi:rare lipoprotein A
VKLRPMILLVAAVPLAPAAFAGSERGIASVYSTDSGVSTASGAGLDPGALTAAHRSLPFGSKVKVTNPGNGRSVVAIINDRGPFVPGRVIDLTPASARALGVSGLASVTVEVETEGRLASPRAARQPTRTSALSGRNRARQPLSRVVRREIVPADDERQRAGFTGWTSEPTPVDSLYNWRFTDE